MPICTNCHIGTLQRKTGAYAAWHAERFVVMPTAPIWVCDVCGERTYDAVVLEQLLPLIGMQLPRDDDDTPTGLHRSVEPPALFENDRTRRRA